MRTYYFKKTYGLLKSNLVSIICSLVIFLILVSISELLTRAEYAKAEVRNKIEATDYASALKAKVDRELNALIFVTSGLASYLTVYHHQIDPIKLQAMLADLYARTQHVTNLGVAVGYTLTYVYPMHASQKVIGLDYRDLPLQWPQVKLAIDSHQGVLDGPVDLVQGGVGLIYRSPVYIHDEYWGLLSTVINKDSFFKAAFKNITNDRYQFAIRSKSSSKLIFGNAQLFQNPKALITVSDFPNTHWEWAILKTAEKKSELLLITRAMGIAISMLLAILAFFFLREFKKRTTEAMQDSLTGTANRRLLNLKLGQSLAQAKKFNRLMAIMFVDIDFLKKINDTYGHEFGDEVIKVVAKKLGECVREVDVLSRVGGDEFVIVLDEINHADDTHSIINKIMQSFEKDLSVLGKHIKTTLSIGVAINDTHQHETQKSLMKKADTALYEAKKRGRNGYVVYQNPEHNQS